MTQNLQEITGKLIELLNDQVADLPPVDAGTDLVSELALESVQIMEFVVEVEDHYDISISLEQLGEVRTIGELAALVNGTLES